MIIILLSNMKLLVFFLSEDKRKYLQSTYHDSEHGGYGETSISIVMPNQITPIP